MGPQAPVISEQFGTRNQHSIVSLLVIQSHYHMLQELDRVFLLADIPEVGLHAGDVGTIVLATLGNPVYEVEFVDYSGETRALLPLHENQIRPIQAQQLPHVRPLQVV